MESISIPELATAMEMYDKDQEIKKLKAENADLKRCGICRYWDPGSTYCRKTKIYKSNKNKCLKWRIAE